MSDAQKLHTRSDATFNLSRRDIRLDDCRRPEDQGIDRIAAMSGVRGWLGFVFLLTATIALVAGLHLVSPATPTSTDITAGGHHHDAAAAVPASPDR